MSPFAVGCIGRNVSISKRAWALVSSATLGALVAMASAACGDAAPNGTPRSGPLSSGASASGPTPPETREGIASIVRDRASVPLEGPRVEALSGDWMIQASDLVAVVSALDGRVIDFGPKGSADGLGFIDSVVWDGLDRARDEVVSIEAVGSATQSVHVVKRVVDRPLLLHVWTWIDRSSLHIDSVMVGTGPKRALSVTLGESVRWGNTPTWVEGHGTIDRGGSFGADFIGRDSQGVAYAACSFEGTLMARFGAPDVAGFHPAARTGESPITIDPGQTSPHRHIVIDVSSASIGEAAMRLPCASLAVERTITVPTGAPEHAELEVAHCEAPLESRPKLALGPATKPEASALLVSKPAASTLDKRADKVFVEPPLEHAPFVRFSAREKQISLPDGCFVARFVALGHAAGAWVSIEDLSTSSARAMPTRGTLSFVVTEKDAPVPAKIMLRGREGTADPDWGDEGTDGAAVNAVYSATGKGTEPLPPGRYHVVVGRGPEYTLHEEDIEVAKDATVSVVAKLERVVDTSGWISADLHVHAIPSFDAPVRLSDRARSLAGVGVEVAVATDHNRITDTRTAIAEAGLSSRLAGVVGDEITSREVDFGHFNAFPLRADAEPPETRSVAPAELFRAMRGAGGPGGAIVIQVNHPRMGDIGYFDLLRLDPEDVAGSIRRSPLFDQDFDALEVFNGDHYADIPKVERAMLDWYALLGSGKHVTATGNSDSHKMTYQEAGVPRNWVRVPDDDPAHFDERAFVDAIRAGKVTVSNGPFITLSSGAAGIGDSIAAGEASLTIHVEAPSWIDVARVELLNKGQLVRVFEGPFEGSGKRFDKTFTEHVERGDFLIAVVRGDQPMRPLLRDKAKPFGFTNPIRAR